MRIAIIFSALLGLAGCATIVPRSASSHDQYFERLRGLCGQAFEGRVVTNEAADREMAAARLVFQVRSCSDTELRIPFHVGNDHGRTWVVSRTATGLRLKHEHRHADGSVAEPDNYGGDTIAPGNPRRQEFPADQFSRDLFVRENIPASVTNIWAIEIVPGRLFVYELRRPGRFFRVEFDLTRPAVPPPPPWGER